MYLLLILFICFVLLSWTQVNGLIKQYKREDITAWGNRSNVITNKLYALVRSSVVANKLYTLVRSNVVVVYIGKI